MDDAPGIEVAVWHSEEFIKDWVDKAGGRESRHGPRLRLMAQLLPFDSESRFTFLDLGAGTGAAASVILDLYPLSTAILTDYSRQMMLAGEIELRRFAGRFRYVELDMSADRWPEQIPTIVDAVVTSMCIHHLPDPRKQGLFKEVHDRLAPGGWYLNYDVVNTPDPVVSAAWERVGARNPTENDDDAPHTALEQAGHDDHLRNITALDPQIGFLRSAGFEGIDVYWKCLDSVIYGGRRPRL